MCQHLFVYGTLRPGSAPDEIAQAAGRMLLVGEASVTGELYDLGHFPGAVLCNDPQRTILGLVFQLPQDDSVLRALDDYEEFFPDAPEICQFRRVPCDVQMNLGGTLRCWIYIYVRSLAGVRRIEDGVWHRPAI